MRAIRKCLGSSLDDIHACDACGKPTHIDLLDGKPPPSDPESPDFTFLACSDCYGPGYRTMVAGQDLRTSSEWGATRKARGMVT
jgi:hypothetical protein